MSETSGMRLKQLLDQLGITGRKLADAIHIDSSMISRWKRNGFGERRVAHNVLLIGEYISGLQLTPENKAWIGAQLHIGVQDQVTPRQIALWLEPSIINDLPGEAETVDPVPDEKPALVGSFQRSLWETWQQEMDQCSHTAVAGTKAVTKLLMNEAMQCAPGTVVKLFLSSETMTCITDDELLHCFQTLSKQRDLHWQLLVQSGSHSAASSRLVSACLPLIVQGYLELNVMHGVPATFTAEMQVILPAQSVVLITEIMNGSQAVVASVTREATVLNDMDRNFDASIRLARPMLTVYDDNFARNIIEIFFAEYGVAGHLDVIKCGMNPMYFTPEHYRRVLERIGNTGDQLAWRYQEFERFKQGLDQVMNTSRNREILCLPKLREIAKTGVCRMPAMYFFGPGIWNLDRLDCVHLFEGYIHYLETSPEFQVVLLDDESLFMQNSCWHIKNDRHIMIHSWDIDKPIMVYSEEMLLIDEFQRHFDNLWSRVSLGMTRRAVIEQMRAFRDECEAPLLQ